MSEENIQQAVDESNADNDLVEALKQVKANSVSKDDYNKLRADNKKLIDALVSGEQLSQPQMPAQRSVEDLQKAIYEHKGSDLEMASDILELYDRQKEMGNNLFISSTNNMSPSEVQDAEYNAEAVANYLRDVVNKCEGDSKKFHTYFNDGIVEVKKR